MSIRNAKPVKITSLPGVRDFLLKLFLLGTVNEDHRNFPSRDWLSWTRMKISERLKSSIREGTPTIRYFNIGSPLLICLVSSTFPQRPPRYPFSVPSYFLTHFAHDRVFKISMIGWSVWPFSARSSLMYLTKIYFASRLTGQGNLECWRTSGNVKLWNRQVCSIRDRGRVLFTLGTLISQRWANSLSDLSRDVTRKDWWRSQGPFA